MKFANSKKAVLVIDYRTGRGDENLCYPEISVAQVPINALNPGFVLTDDL